MNFISLGRQRVMIAMALTLQAARIDRRRAHHRAGRHGAGSDLDLLQDLQEQTGTPILITHDMGAIAEMARRDGDVRGAQD